MQIKTIKKGAILIARPVLSGDVFNRSVVLLTDHSEENGSVGFVLNKSLDLPIGDFITNLNTSKFEVYEGGPVDQENIYYLHSRPDLISDSILVYNDLYWSGKYDDVKNAINNGYLKRDEIRFYLGYSGWSKSQLQDEINQNAWTVVMDDSLNIFEDWSNDLWKQQMKKLGGENLLWVNMPENPQDN